MIAIVGSSGSVLKHKHGSIIDKHDIVVRFNDAPTKGFGKYVGNKTDLRWIAYHGADYDLKDESIFLYSYNKEAQREAYEKLHRDNAVSPLPKRYIRYCDDMISKPYWKWRFLPGRIIIHKKMSTTGLKAIIYNIENIGFPPTNLFGFNEDEQFHYYEPNRKGYNQDDSHDFNKEREIIK